MLVIISDLHFTDGTTSNRDEQGRDLFNIAPRAFELFFGKISNIVGRRDDVRRVTFVYGGDIFDLLRTYAWFDIHEAERPWALPLDQEAANGHARAILKKAADQNEEALLWLSGRHPRFEEIWKAGCQVERVYLPGNHDRIINLDKGCRRLVWEKLLGEPGRDDPFDNFYLDQEHETLVMHGHESDRYNCVFDDEDTPRYARVPIGDPMTTMLFARAGWLAGDMDIPEGARRRFRDLDNVRPPLAGIRFIQDTLRDFDIKDEIEKMLRRISEDFKDLPFYEKWVGEYDGWWWDEVDSIQAVLQVLKLTGTAIPAGLIEKVSGLFKNEDSERLASGVLRSSLGAAARYCILGHTHCPAHVPLFLDEASKVEKHYLNTGTFRTTYALAYDREGFMSLQRMSYVVIYGPGEVAGYGKPIYEMWSGLRKRY